MHSQANLYNPVLLNENDARSTAAKSMANCLLKHEAWKTLCPALTSRPRVRWRVHTAWSALILTVLYFIDCGTIMLTYITELLRLLDDLEHITRATDPHAHEALLQTRMAIDKSVARIDNLESSFDRIAERSRECRKYSTTFIADNIKYSFVCFTADIIPETK